MGRIRFNEIVEKKILKIRYLYEYNTGGWSDDDSVRIHRLDGGLEVDAEGYPEKMLQDIKLKKNGDSWVLFTVHHDRKITGYSFLHIPSTCEMHDSLPTCPDEARECNSYVFPEYRRMGFRGKLLSAQKKFCSVNKKRMWAVIEKSNIASISSSIENGGTQVGTNLLFKLFGKNFLSVLLWPFKLYFVYKRN